LIALVLGPFGLLFGALAVIGLKTGVMRGPGGDPCSSQSGASEHEQPNFFLGH